MEPIDCSQSTRICLRFYQKWTLIGYYPFLNRRKSTEKTKERKISSKSYSEKPINSFDINKNKDDDVIGRIWHFTWLPITEYLPLLILVSDFHFICEIHQLSQRCCQRKTRNSTIVTLYFVHNLNFTYRANWQMDENERKIETIK